MQSLQQFPLAAFAHQWPQSLQGGQELHPLSRQWCQGLEIHPLVLEADGTASLGQLGGGSGISNWGLHHAGSQGDGRILVARGLHMQWDASALGGLGQHPGELPAAHDPDWRRRAHGPD
jgi:hypothetical protein